jgi:hypothetical protein
LIVVFGFCFGGWDASQAMHEALLARHGASSILRIA